MKSSLIAAAALAATLALPARAATYVVDSHHTYPRFEISHLGLTIQRGLLDKTSGKVTLDRAAKTGSIEITIQAASIDTGIARRDADLRSARFFDVERYPEIIFRSTELHFNGDTLTRIDGTLSMHGVTRPLTLDVIHFHCGLHPLYRRPACGADAIAIIKRSDFGIIGDMREVGDRVKLLLNIEAIEK